MGEICNGKHGEYHPSSNPFFLQNSNHPPVASSCYYYTNVRMIPTNYSISSRPATTSHVDKYSLSSFVALRGCVPQPLPLIAARSPVHTCILLTAATCCLLLSATSAFLTVFNFLNYILFLLRLFLITETPSACSDAVLLLVGRCLLGSWPPPMSCLLCLLFKVTPRRWVKTIIISEILIIWINEVVATDLLAMWSHTAWSSRTIRHQDSDRWENPWPWSQTQ